MLEQLRIRAWKNIWETLTPSVAAFESGFCSLRKWSCESCMKLLENCPLASLSSCLDSLIHMDPGREPFSLQSILNSCTLGFQDVMKCTGPFGELGRWQYNYAGRSLMSYTLITSLPPEAKVGQQDSGGFIKWEEERRGSFNPCICFCFELFHHVWCSCFDKSLLLSPFSSLICTNFHSNMLEDSKEIWWLLWLKIKTWW